MPKHKEFDGFKSFPNAEKAIIPSRLKEECKKKREQMLKLFQKKNKDDYIDIRSSSEIYENFETFFARQDGVER